MAADAVAVTTTRTAFAWQHAPEPWHQLLFALTAIGLAWWAWRRYGPAPARALGVIARLCRVVAIVLAVAMVMGPAWRTTATTELPARITVAIDRSASMTREDGAQRQARIAAASDLARALAPLTKPRRLALAYRGVGGVPGEISADDLVRAPPSATGASSPLADDCLGVLAAERPDHLVLVTDGRITEGSPWPALADQLRARGLQVSILAVGGMTVDPGLWLDEIDVNKDAALAETEPIIVHFSARALPPGETIVRLLVDGTEVAHEKVVVPANADPAALADVEQRLETTFEKPGPAKLRIELEHGALKDARDLAVVVAQRKLQVLMLEGRPRYESRYLREALKRDHTITIHAYLLDGRPRRWQTDGPGDHVPLGAHELKDYDAVIIGDVGPDMLPEPDAALEALSRAVNESGTGIVWIPGESGATARFARTKAGERLLPVDLPDEATLGGGYRAGAPHHLVRTPIAEAQRLFDSGGSPWADLPELLGAAPLTTERVRHGADVLMVDQDGAPIVVAQQLVGAGRTALIAVDDTWRWRRNVGDRYLHRFHSQLLRYVAAGRRQNPNAWHLLATPHRAVPGEPVTLGLTPGRSNADPGTDRAVARLVGPDGREQRVDLVRDGSGFSARVPAPPVGTWTIDLVDGPNPAETEAAELIVLPPTGEVRDPRADRPALAELARATGSEVFDDAATLVRALPDKHQVREDVLPSRGLWDNAWTLAALVTLLAIEWALRRANRLP